MALRVVDSDAYESDGTAAEVEIRDNDGNHRPRPVKAAVVADGHFGKEAAE